MTFEPIAVMAFLSLGLLMLESVRRVIGAFLGAVLSIIVWIAYAIFWLAVFAGIVAGAIALGPMWVIVLILLLMLFKS